MGDDSYFPRLSFTFPRTFLNILRAPPTAGSSGSMHTRVRCAGLHRLPRLKNIPTRVCYGASLITSCRVPYFHLCFVVDLQFRQLKCMKFTIIFTETHSCKSRASWCWTWPAMPAETLCSAKTMMLTACTSTASLCLRRLARWTSSRPQKSTIGAPQHCVSIHVAARDPTWRLCAYGC